MARVTKRPKPVKVQYEKVIVQKPYYDCPSCKTYFITYGFNENITTPSIDLPFNNIDSYGQKAK